MGYFVHYSKESPAYLHDRFNTHKYFVKKKTKLKKVFTYLILMVWQGSPKRYNVKYKNFNRFATYFCQYPH